MVYRKNSRILTENHIVMIERLYLTRLQEELTQTKKVVVLYGARQVGKTTLVREVLSTFPGKVLEVNADLQQYTDVLSGRNLDKLKGLVQGYDLLFIDEAQRIPDIGINLKILRDNLPDLRIIVTGSSSLDLANRIKEPLTGRTWTYTLYPISVGEWMQHSNANAFENNAKLDEWMRYGMYPEVFQIGNHSRKEQYLQEISQSYLYKDLLMLTNIKYPEKLRQLLRLLAYQIGNQVSINELSNTLQINREAILNYIDLLEKSFVIFRLGGLSRNLRKEVSSMSKIYFYDLGIRNALIENFNPLETRQDVGQLWENFLLVERMKHMAYSSKSANRYFWRTYTGAELDYVEESNGQFRGYEFKWGDKTVNAPTSWKETYPDASFQCINRNNFLPFLTQ